MFTTGSCFVSMGLACSIIDNIVTGTWYVVVVVVDGICAITCVVICWFVWVVSVELWWIIGCCISITWIWFMVCGVGHWSIVVVIKDGKAMVCCSVSSCSSIDSGGIWPKVDVALKLKCFVNERWKVSEKKLTLVEAFQDVELQHLISLRLPPGLPVPLQIIM